MLFRSLLLSALTVAPTGAWAFGDLDCIGTEFCSAGTCTQSVMVFPVVFDWPNNAISITAAGDTLRMTLQTPDVTPDGTSGQLSYAEPATADGAGLLLDFAGEDITMMLFMGQDAGTHHATCAAREAA